MPTSVSTIRRLAARHDERVRKLSQNSKWFWQYGPYYVVDNSTSGVIESGLDLDDLIDRYTSAEPG